MPTSFVVTSSARERSQIGGRRDGRRDLHHVRAERATARHHGFEPRVVGRPSEVVKRRDRQHARSARGGDDVAGNRAGDLHVDRADARQQRAKEREAFRFRALPTAALGRAADRREQRHSRKDVGLREYVLDVEAREVIDAQLGDVHSLRT